MVEDLLSVAMLMVSCSFIIVDYVPKASVKATIIDQCCSNFHKICRSEPMLNN